MKNQKTNLNLIPVEGMWDFTLGKIFFRNGNHHRIGAPHSNKSKATNRQKPRKR